MRPISNIIFNHGEYDGIYGNACILSSKACKIMIECSYNIFPLNVNVVRVKNGVEDILYEIVNENENI